MKAAIAWGRCPLSFRFEASRRGFEIIALGARPEDIRPQIKQYHYCAVVVETAQDVLEALEVSGAERTFLVCSDRDIPTFQVWDVDGYDLASGGAGGLRCVEREPEPPPPEFRVRLQPLPKKTTAS